MALKRDPLELRLYSALKTAQQRVSGWPCSMPVPVLCAVGMQSAGKTTFIEALVGFRIGTTCMGTGTRCPVRYILKDGPPHFTVGGKEVEERSDIQLAVDHHMRTLSAQKSSAGFSKEELKVEISDRDLPLLDITDLPGLKAKGAGAEEIKSVVKFYVEQQSARPVVLVKATESVETQADVELLKEVGIDPKKGNATFVVNYFNDQLYKFSHASELNDYCRGYVQEYGCVYFCMLIYSQAAKDAKDRLSFEGQCMYYRQLPQKEKETFDQKLKSMTLDVEFHEEDVIGRFGVTPAIKEMQSVIRDFILREGKKYADKLGPLQFEHASHLSSIQEELRRCNPEYIKAQREKYVERWGEVVRDVQRCRKRPGDDSDLNPISFGTSFFEELKEVHALNNRTTLLGESAEKDSNAALRGWQEVVRKLRWEVASLDLDGLLKMDLTADASLGRLGEAFDAVIEAQIPIQKVQENEARAISGYAPGDMPGALDPLQVIKEVATRPLAQVRARVWPMLVHIEVIYSHALSRAHASLRGHPGHTDSLEAAISEAYKRFMREKIKEAQERFKDIITEKTSYIPVNEQERIALLSILQNERPPNTDSCCWCFLRPTVSRAPHWVEEVNRMAGEKYQHLRGELVWQFKTVVANSLFSYLNRQILLDVRDDLRQQIRDTDARRIDEDARARASELRTQEGALKESLSHIRSVLDLVEQLDSSGIQAMLEDESPQSSAIIV